MGLDHLRSRSTGSCGGPDVQTAYEIDNRQSLWLNDGGDSAVMPREEIEITLSEEDPYWSGALYFAHLAYPEFSERTQRDKFHQAIVRWTLFQRIEIDRNWAQNLQIIRPAYFSGDDRLHERILHNGNKRLERRMIIAQLVVLPHLRKFDTGRTHKPEGLDPTLKNMLVLAAAELGLSESTVNTMANRDWRPVKPVAHAMCAYVVWSTILWEMWERKASVNRKLAFLMLPEYVAEVVEISEHFRPQVCSIADFHISEEQTVRLTTRQI